MSQVLLIPGVGRMSFASALRLLQPYSPRLAANYMDPLGSLYTDASRTTQVAAVGNRIRSFTNQVTGQPHGAASSDAKSPLWARYPATGRRNLLTYTEDLTNAIWTKTRTSAPATNQVFETAVSGVHAVTQSVTDATTSAEVFSVSAKSNGRNRIVLVNLARSSSDATFDLDSGTIVNQNTNAVASITPEADGYYRCSVAVATKTAGTFTREVWLVDGSGATSYLGDITKGVFLERLQIGPAGNYQKVVTSADITEAGVRDVYAALFDGSDDCLQVSGFDLSNTNKATVIAFGRKQVSGGCIVELSAISTTDKALTLTCSNIAGSEFFWATGGTGGGTGDRAVITTSDGAGVFSFCAVGGYDRTQVTAATQIKTQLNGVTPTLVTQQNGTLAGNFLNDTLNIGGRNNSATLPLNGYVHYLFICGAIVPDDILTRIFRGLGPRIGLTV